MQIYHISTLKGLKLQKKNDFWNKRQTDLDPNHDPQLDCEWDLKNSTKRKITNQILSTFILCKYAVFLLLMGLNYKKRFF